MQKETKPRRLRLVVGFIVGMVASAAVAYGLFSSLATNSANTVSALDVGTVGLSDGGAPMFTVVDLDGGTAPVVKCLQITNDGTLTAAPKVYVGNLAGTGLNAFLQLDIRHVDDAGGASFADDVACAAATDFADITSPATTLDSWPIDSAGGVDLGSFAPAVAGTYRFEISIPSSDPGAQGLTSGFDVIVEIG